MRIFFGAGMQGVKDRKSRSGIYTEIISLLKKLNHEVLPGHTNSKNIEEALELLEKSIGPLPKEPLKRKAYVRDKMIEMIESDIDAAIFEVSTPSLGTGVELTHVYLREKIGLKPIPILALYQKDFWPNGLSTMIIGITKEKVPDFNLKEYENLDQLKEFVTEFLSKKE